MYMKNVYVIVTQTILDPFRNSCEESILYNLLDLIGIKKNLNFVLENESVKILCKEKRNHSLALLFSFTRISRINDSWMEKYSVRISK